VTVIGGRNDDTRSNGVKRPEENNPMNGADAARQAAPRGQRQGNEFAAPLGSVRSGRLIFASGASWVTVRADPSMADLYHARFEGQVPRAGAQGGTVTIRYPRFPLFDWLYYLRERPAEVALNAQIPWDIEIRNGVSRLTGDLRGLELRSLEVRGGTSRVEVTLPTPSGIVPVRVLGGASNVAIHRPGGVAAQLRVVGGSTNLAFDERRFGAVGGEVSLQSPDYEGASDRYDITITGGASSVIIDAR
jgi:hypothetical protein